MGANLDAVERMLESQFEVERAVGVGRAALGLAVVLRVWAQSRPDTRVALPAAVCHDVVLAVMAAGCIPVFCDVAVETGLVQRSEWLRARAAGATVAIVVHLYGNPADVAEVAQIFAAPKCLVIDDAAQALGSRTAAGLAGGQGDVGLLSFRATKQISTGGAAVLFRDAAFAEDVMAALREHEAAHQSHEAPVDADFRRRLELARAELRLGGRAAAHHFAGLLDGQAGSLEARFPAEAAGTLQQDLKSYPDAVARRLAKRDLWLAGVKDHALEPVGMGDGAVPWRFVCRLPGTSWAVQHELGNELRSHGMNVSHWYLPAHWMYSSEPDALPGVERLSSEVFQFWIDDATTPDEVERQVAITTRIVQSHV